MGWFSQRRELDELRKQVAHLTQLLAHQTQPAGFDGSRMLEIMLEGQVKQVDSFGGFIRMISDVAAERAGSVMGRRGGRKRAATAARDARGRMLPVNRSGRASDCRLCDDANCADFTTAEFDAHQQHKGRQRRIEAEPVEPARDEQEIIHRPDIPPMEYPLPHVHHPLVPIPRGDENSGANGDSQTREPADPGHRNGVA